MELITAAKNGDFITVFNLLQQGHPASARDHDNATPLYWSACHGHGSLCEVLIEGGSDVNARVKWGSTALHAASDRGHTECVKILIENGADVNCQNNRGDIPLHIAAYRGNSAITRQLLCAGSDTSQRNDKGKTPEEEAMEGGHQDVAQSIAAFMSGNTKVCPQTNSQNGGIHRATPSNVHIRTDIHNATPLATERTNGMYRPPIFRSLGSGTSSSLTESLCSSGDVTCGTESYDSSVFNSVPENSQLIKDLHGSLKRSVSVGGSDKLPPMHYVTYQPTRPLVPKTNSVSNIPFSGYLQNNVCENDVNVTYSSVDSLYPETSKRKLTNKSDRVHVMNTSYSPNFSTKLTSNGRCIATESVDDTEFRTPEESQVLRRQMPDMRSQQVAIQRPLRASTGSVQDIARQSESQDSFIKTLQIQLVNAYKDIEKLTNEREDLKFKCSTVINRLTDTEHFLEEKTRECEMISELVDVKKKTRTDMCTRGTARVHLDEDDTCGSPGVGLIQLSSMLTSRFPEVSQLQKIMQGNLHSLYQCTSVTGLSDTSGEEWVPGVDYVIMGENQPTWLKPKSTGRVPLSTAFTIKHLKSGKRLVLKMLLTLENPQVTHWTFEPYILNSRDCLWRHPNVDKPVYQFEGSTERFKKFVCAPGSKSVQLCDRTSFIVTNETKTFRTLLESINSVGDSVVCSEVEYGSYVEFIVQIIQQMLSLVGYMEDNGVIHGNVTEDTIVVDKSLRPLLSEIEVTCGRSSSWKPADQLSDKIAGTEYENIKYINKGEDGGDFRSVCQLFQRIMSSSLSGVRPSAGATTMLQKLSSVQKLLYTITVSTSTQTLTSKSVLQRIGCILYGPEKHSVHSLNDCQEFLLAHLLQMTTALPDNRFNRDYSEYISVKESVVLRRQELKACFLCNISAEELWDTYQCCDRDNMLVLR